MATNPMLQAVMLFQHHQTTTPYLPIQTTSVAQAEVPNPTEPAQPEELDDKK